MTESVVSVFGTASTSTDPYSDRIGNDGRAYLQDLNILNATDSSAGEFRPTVQDLVRRQLKGQWRILRKNVHEERSGPRMSRYGPVMEGNVGEGQTVQSMDDRMPNQIWESTLSHIGPYSQIGSGMTDKPTPPYRSQKGSEDLSQSSSIYSQQRLQSQYESYQRWDTTPSCHSSGYSLRIHIPDLLSDQPSPPPSSAAMYESSDHASLTDCTRFQSSIEGHPGWGHFFEASPALSSCDISHLEKETMGNGPALNLSISRTHTSQSTDYYGNNFVNLNDSMNDSNTDSI